MRARSLCLPLCLLLCAGCAGGSADPAPSSTPSASASTSAATGPAPSASAAAASRPADPLHGENLLATATFLAAPDFRGREAGTEDERRAATFLGERLDALGIAAPEGGRSWDFPFGSRTSQNVLGVITTKESQEWILIGAHYDHEGIRSGTLYPGAEDNASGVAVTLALAQALSERRAELGRNVAIVFFGAEERGLVGSRAFVERWDHARTPLALMVNVDMIGRPLVDQPLLWLGARALGVLKGVDPDRAVGVLLSEDAPALTAAVKETTASAGVTAITIADLPESLRAPVAGLAQGRGDHAPFERMGVPFVFFSSGESSDYHQPTDTADRLDPAILELRARAILAFVLHASKLPRAALAASPRGR